MKNNQDNVLVVRSCPTLQGEVRLPGDKSVSHRAVILSSIAEGESIIEGAQKGKDVLATVNCMRELGVSIKEEGQKLLVEGKGLGGLIEPQNVLDCQNSGTTMRILSGLLAAHGFYSVLTGDSSLRKRPMQRITYPLSGMGAKIWTREGYLAPLSIKGGHLRGIDYPLSVASAQVKSCILLAGLHARGRTRVREPFPSRDHTERMLQFMGANINVDSSGITIEEGKIKSVPFFVPGDISAGAFFLGAAAVLRGSTVVFKKVGVNPTRSGFLDVLGSMGARIKIYNKKVMCGEEVADIKVEGEYELEGVRIGQEKIPQLLDEVPILAVVACFAKGKTVIEGARELRLKETDRIKAMCKELTNLGAVVEEKEDGMVVHGKGELQGGDVQSWGDHRVAMALAVAGICAKGTTTVHQARCIDVSFPQFSHILQKLGANLEK